MSSPYEGLPAEAFWRTGVSRFRSETPDGLYKKKFSIDRSTRVAAAGSCFAQHIVRQLRTRGFDLVDKEPPPVGLPEADARRFGYQTYSARFGNIYTARQLLQLTEETFGMFEPEDAIWKKDGRYYDALRPSVEPRGLPTEDEVREHRGHHLRRVNRLIRSCDLFIFTLGLTEAWEHTKSGTVFPTAPGTIAGEFDPSIYRFRNFDFSEVYKDMRRFIGIAKRKNPGLKFILTVSPVPLTATASGQHVLAATTYSKSVLRAVAGKLYEEMPDVDYVPSYELITGAQGAGRYFEDNLRSVTSEGVDAVMTMFFGQHESDQPLPTPPREARRVSRAPTKSDVICEEALLEAFAES